MATLKAKAASLNIVIEQGATFNEVFTWKDTSNTLINLTGYSAQMQVRSTKEDTVILWELSSTLGTIILGGVAGTITLYIDKSDTALFTFDSSVYDLELTDPSGRDRRLLKGSVIIDTEVTR